MYNLPIIPGKHKDLKTISPDTVADVVNGCYGDKLGEVTIIDCRYPYEYVGGHIKVSILYNLPKNRYKFATNFKKLSFILP